MYVTAHRVQRGGATGINTFLHLHRGVSAAINWNHPDVGFVADQCPGVFAVQRAEIPPGNNAVSSYFDLVAADHADRAQLLLSIAQATFPGSAGDVWYDGAIGYRYYCSPRLDASQEFELLRAHVGLLVHDASTRGALAPADDPLVINIGNDDTGVQYWLDERSRARLLARFPHKSPASIGVFFENRDVIIGLWGPETFHTEIAKAVTGLSEGELSALGGVMFRDEYGAESPGGSVGVGASEIIRGQEDGFWYGPGEAIPEQVPSWEPTGAILRGRQGANALLLVPLEFRWHPMSEAAIYTYRHSTGMQNGERWTFLIKATGQRFLAQLADSLNSVVEVERLYGPVAASLARPNRPTVQIQLTPVPKS